MDFLAAGHAFGFIMGRTRALPQSIASVECDFEPRTAHQNFKASGGTADEPPGIKHHRRKGK